MTFGQALAPTPQSSGQPGVTIEEVIVTGSNIPTSEEVGPNPVDTYRREDITRLGVRSATDLIQKLPAAELVSDDFPVFHFIRGLLEVQAQLLWSELEEAPPLKTPRGT
jgi:hypothetical protein